jgi:hypothetical protein
MVNFSTQNLAQKQLAEGQALIEQIQGKMRRLADEFAIGEINREQFYKIYEHYQTQLNLASAMVAEADALSLANLPAGETIAIRKRLTAMAKAAAIYYHATGEWLETIGEFHLPMSSLMPTLSAIVGQARTGGEAEPQARQIGGEWLLFVPGQFSTVVMVFSHEPVMRQIAIVQNMHRNFEAANITALLSGQTQAAKLVYPFITFVRRSVRKQPSR